MADVTNATDVGLPGYYGHDHRVHSRPTKARPSQDGDTHQPNYYQSPLSSETNLTLTVTVTQNLKTKLSLERGSALTLLNPNICAHIVDTYKNLFPNL